MVKILITGAAGFIGANLTRKLIKTGNEINILIKEASNLWRINDIISNCNVHKIDLKKLSAAKMGKKMPPMKQETKKKISIANKGKPKSSEHRKKISEAKKGKPSAISKEGRRTITTISERIEMVTL